MATGIVKSYELRADGITCFVDVDGTNIGVPVTVNWTDPNARSTICVSIKLHCSSYGKPVDTVVLPDMYVE